MPEPFGVLRGKAAPLSSDDVDTDQIIPAQFLKVTEKAGLGRYLFYRLRYDDQGRLTGKFVLDRPEFNGATFLVAGRNFGIGSSRENAVWALADKGIRCVVADSYGDIFYNNAAKNGILCIRLSGPELASLRERAASGELTLEADLPAQTLHSGASRIAFEIEPHIKERLIGGMDEIGMTLSEYHGMIIDYERRAPRFLQHGPFPTESGLSQNHSDS